MVFFKRILQETEIESEPPAVERRTWQRFRISPDFALKAVLSFIGRDESGAPLSSSRHGWTWKGHLVDISEEGARMQMGPGLRAKVGDSCDLVLTIWDFELTVPCNISNIREREEGTVFGLKHDIADEKTWLAYRQLIEVIALGSTLRQKSRSTKPDESGYLVEQYASDRPSRLTVWRLPRAKAPAAFEFLLKDSLVCAVAGKDPEYLTGTDAASAVPAPMAKATEVFRLFQWVVPNLAPVVPDDVRKFLRHYTG